ncbi:MAG: MurR/RpiR family transcriptional regulator [Roseibium sp.]|uniref:MurR/RpiR family transcriptional regulator n=1 Tax=Roseibium sp. TaxID=1936156 RepID=UPI003D9C5398
MVQTARLSERILESFDDLTKSERLLAEHFLENPDSLALHTAEEISSLANVSKATTARFFKRLGFPSFKTAQRMARVRRNDSQHTKRVFSEPIQQRSGRGDLADHLASDVQNLIRTIEAIRGDELKDAVTYLARAEKVWVVGFGDNYPLAHFARAQLIKVKPDIRMIPLGGFPVPEEFASIRPSDAVLALAIGRRTATLRSILQSARLSGARTISVTDLTSSGNSELAEVTLRCRTSGLSYFDSLASPVSVMTYLCMAVADRLGQNAVDRLKYIDGIHSEWGDLG